MHGKVTEINLDKSLRVKMKVIYKNALVLYFKFYDKNSSAIDVTGISFKFLVTDTAKSTELLNVTSWQRLEANSIKYVLNSLTIIPDEYLLDFTCTYSDGRIQTLMDGNFIVRERNIIS